MLLKESIIISCDDTTQTLHDKLSQLGAQTIIQALTLLQQNRLTPVSQDEARACYADKINKNEALIDWSKPAEQIDRAIRAYNPAPGAYTFFEDRPSKSGRPASSHTTLINRERLQPSSTMALLSPAVPA